MIPKKEVRILNKVKFILMTQLYCCGNFYDLDDRIHEKMYKIIDIDTTCLENRRAIEISKVNSSQIFKFRHYSVCEKQEFVNNFANDILPCLLMK